MRTLGYRIKWMVVLAVMGMVLAAVGCRQGYTGGLGGVLPSDYRQGEIRVQVRGEMRREAHDGYTPLSGQMEGMGVGMTDTPLSFTANIWAGAPVNGEGLRNFCLTYTSPSSLQGTSVSCRLSQDDQGTWKPVYTLSLVGSEWSWEVEAAAVDGLLLPIRGLLPMGDVTAVSASRGDEPIRMKITEESGGVCELSFEAATDPCPTVATWQDDRRSMEIRITPVSE